MQRQFAQQMQNALVAILQTTFELSATPAGRPTATEAAHKTHH
jgi:hypothetical protein